MVRPVKTEHERRSQQVKIRLTLAEVEFLRAQAAAAGLSMAGLVRRRAVGLPVRPARSQVDDQVLAELNRIGVNINQLARAQNRGRFPEYWQEVGVELERLMEVVGDAYDSQDSQEG